MAKPTIAVRTPDGLFICSARMKRTATGRAWAIGNLTRVPDLAGRFTHHMAAAVDRYVRGAVVQVNP